MSTGLNKDLPGPPGPGFPGAPAWLSAPTDEPPSAAAEQADQKTTVFRTGDDEPAQEPPIDDGLEDWNKQDDSFYCPHCGSIERWWNTVGVGRCARCDPPSTSRRLLWLKEQELASRPEMHTRADQIETPTGPHCSRCLSQEFRYIEIHDGQSRRRECGKCGRFIDFPVWHGVARSDTAEPHLTRSVGGE